MALKIVWFCLFVAGLIASSQVQGQRISQIKCEEYIEETITRVDIIPLILNPTPITLTSFNCSKTVDLIVGGEEAKRGEFRHQVLLGWVVEGANDYQFDCGGTLISHRYVLTAAHCASKSNFSNPAPVVVRFAEHNLKVVEDEYDIDIEQIIRHPQHRFRHSYHDIALVRLKKDVRFSALVRPACLWDDEDMNVKSVIATGFGKMDFSDDKGSDILRKVQLTVFDLNDCNPTFLGTRSFPSGMTEEQLCAGSELGGKDTCQGDSGGPIQVLLNPDGCIYHVIGVTSKGAYCGGRAPAVYTKVASYLDWIEKIVWRSE